MIYAGLGFRGGCQSGDIVRAVAAALAGAGRELSEVQALCVPDFKAGEPALSEVAEQLGKPLVVLAAPALQRQAAFALTQSTWVMVRFGLPSIAETAALAGAAGSALAPSLGPARLLGARRVAGGATCALACLKTTNEGAQ